MISSNPYLENWLALRHAVGFGLKQFNECLQNDPDLTSIPKQLKPDWLGVKRDLAWLDKRSTAHIITLRDDCYPQLLKAINNPPPILYVLGDHKLLSQPQIAMVGTRKPTRLGLWMADKFARDLASMGYVITSGLAEGVDGASHRGALSTGHTVAVAAHGLDSIYPKQHRQLAYDIVEKGCLVSEYPIGVEARAFCFPQRNRIISGLCMGVLVVEAAAKSGSLITARYAGEQGREVFAIPGAINNFQTKGCHQLIKQGAKLVECTEDVTEELANLLKCVIRDKNATKDLEDLKQYNLDEVQNSLLRNVDIDGTCFDEIVARTGFDSARVGSTLVELELFGLITMVPGGYARRLG